MNLNDAMNAHVGWKTKLRGAITKKEQLDASTISKDDCCEFGKWLHGDGKREFASLTKDATEHFNDCVKKHADFHRAAGVVAKLINERKYIEAETAIGAGSAYAAASSAVGVAIQKLKKDVAGETDSW